MSLKFVCLSYALSEEAPLYGNTPKPVITPYTMISKGDRSNSYSLSVNNHSGTHVDAPGHFIEGGKRICDYKTNELVFSNVLVLDLPKKTGEWVEETDLKANATKQEAAKADCLIIITGFYSLRNKPEYRENNPGISPEAIAWARANMKKLRCIGIDTISVSSITDRERGRKAHRAAFESNAAFSEPLLLIEDMDLSQINGKRIKQMLIVPWLIEKIDSAPCTVLAGV
jgi:kynurenine formamidase